MSTTATMRLSGSLLLAAVVVFCGAFAIAVLDPDASYSWHANMISDLGDPSCRVWDQRLVCSPRFASFNAGVVASGGLLGIAAVRLWHVWGGRLACFVIALGLGLVLLGLFPAGSTSGLHMTGAVLALPVASLGIMLSGLRPPNRWLFEHSRLRVGLGAGALLLCLGHLLPGSTPVPQGAAEMLAISALLCFLILESWRLLSVVPGKRPSHDPAVRPSS